MIYFCYEFNLVQIHPQLKSVTTKSTIHHTIFQKIYSLFTVRHSYSAEQSNSFKFLRMLWIKINRAAIATHFLSHNNTNKKIMFFIEECHWLITRTQFFVSFDFPEYRRSFPHSVITWNEVIGKIRLDNNNNHNWFTVV